MREKAKGGAGTRETKSLWAVAKSEFRRHLTVLTVFLAFLWLVHLVNVATGDRLRAFGIEPRTTHGLVGILFAPFLHNDVSHLFSNTIGVLTLGWLVMIRETWHFPIVALFSLVIGGFVTWTIGGSGVHAGASGIVYGFFGYLLLSGWFSRSFGWILFSLATFACFGGLLYGMTPAAGEHISISGHVGGFLGGVVAAYLLEKRRRRISLRSAKILGA